MDQDIANAADSMALAKIKAQDYRDSRNSMLNLASALSSQLNGSYAALDGVEKLEFKRELALVIADHYLTTSTATIDATVLLDAQNDVKRAKAAYDEFLRVFVELT